MTVTGTEILTSLMAKTATELLTDTVAKNAKRWGGRDKTKNITTNIRPHIEATKKKCLIVKTLLNPQSPTQFLQIYSTQRFIHENKIKDHYDVVDLMRNGPNNFILSGNGGSGKSMFTRYLWISVFESFDGRVPLFVELRNLNSEPTGDIKEFIFRNIIHGAATMTESDFAKFLIDGNFFIILDGYDEVVESKKNEVQKTIILLAEEFPNNKILVTSRPDNNFSSWPYFEVIQVASLKEKDVLELIEKAEFPEDLKNAFLAKIKTDKLFEKHKSFLSNPLLASIMLLTFSHNFDIPDRMHLFYEQAFDALYQRHDRYKPGGFKREFKTNLSEDIFKRVLSFFCLLTYHDIKVSFSKQDVVQYIKRAATAANVNLTPESFLEDLTMCVCFLIVDELDYNFSHRSFQEYFAAYCMNLLENDQFYKLANTFSQRYNDQVISLIAEMYPDTLRRHYILRFYNQNRSLFELDGSSNSVLQFFSSSEIVFNIRKLRIYRENTGVHDGKKINKNGRARLIISVVRENGLLSFCQIVQKLDPGENKFAPSRAEEAKDQAAARKLFQLAERRQLDSIFLWASDGNVVVAEDSGDIVDPTVQKLEEKKIDVDAQQAKQIFLTSFMFKWIQYMLTSAIEYVEKQAAIEASLSNAIDDIFR